MNHLRELEDIRNRFRAIPNEIKTMTDLDTVSKDSNEVITDLAMKDELLSKCGAWMLIYNDTADSIWLRNNDKELNVKLHQALEMRLPHGGRLDFEGFKVYQNFDGSISLTFHKQDESIAQIVEEYELTVDYTYIETNINKMNRAIVMLQGVKLKMMLADVE